MLRCREIPAGGMTGYDPARVEEMLRSMHDIDHAADQKRHEMIIEPNRQEGICDELYLKGTRSLPTHTADVLTILFWREIYDKPEACADACEHVGDSIERIVMKNT